MPSLEPMKSPAPAFRRFIPSEIVAREIAATGYVTGRDGNCLFDAVAELDSLNRDGGELRALVATYLRDNRDNPVFTDEIQAMINRRDELDTLITRDGIIYPTDIDHYLSLMAQDQTWGTGRELAALADIIMRPIYVYMRDPDTTMIIYSEGAAYAANPPLELDYDGLHYEARHPMVDRLSAIETPSVDPSSYRTSLEYTNTTPLIDDLTQPDTINTIRRHDLMRQRPQPQEETGRDIVKDKDIAKDKKVAKTVAATAAAAVALEIIQTIDTHIQTLNAVIHCSPKRLKKG
jgi:hypothetical protein